MIYPSLKDNGYNERFSVGLIAPRRHRGGDPALDAIPLLVSAQQSAVAPVHSAGILRACSSGWSTRCT